MTGFEPRCGACNAPLCQLTHPQRLLKVLQNRTTLRPKSFWDFRCVYQRKSFLFKSISIYWIVIWDTHSVKPLFFLKIFHHPLNSYNSWRSHRALNLTHIWGDKSTQSLSSNFPQNKSVPANNWRSCLKDFSLVCARSMKNGNRRNVDKTQPWRRPVNIWCKPAEEGCPQLPLSGRGNFFRLENLEISKPSCHKKKTWIALRKQELRRFFRAYFAYAHAVRYPEMGRFVTVSVAIICHRQGELSTSQVTTEEDWWTGRGMQIRFYESVIWTRDDRRRAGIVNG